MLMFYRLWSLECWWSYHGDWKGARSRHWVGWNVDSYFIIFFKPGKCRLFLHIGQLQCKKYDKDYDLIHWYQLLSLF